LLTKKDIDDVRESPALEILKGLDEAGASWKVVDPYVTTFKHDNRFIDTISLTLEAIKSADLVIITTDHSDFDYNLIAEEASVIFDTRNSMKNVLENVKGRYYKL